MNTFTVRRAEPLDRLSLVELALRSGVEYHEKSDALIAENGKPVGCVFYRHLSNVVQVHGLGVPEQYRGHGLEARLINAAVEHAATSGADLVVATAEHGQERTYVLSGFTYDPGFAQHKGRDVLVKEL